MSRFGTNIRPQVEVELSAAAQAAARGKSQEEFAHLERAHVLGQSATAEHVRVHWRMLLWGLRQRNAKECFGQVFRLTGAATKTAFGLAPHGNTGGSNVSPFKPMPVPAELEAHIQSARASVQ
jgi:Protein of unknown function (DUF3703)